MKSSRCFRSAGVVDGAGDDDYDDGEDGRDGYDGPVVADDDEDGDVAVVLLLSASLTQNVNTSTLQCGKCKNRHSSSRLQMFQTLLHKH